MAGVAATSTLILALLTVATVASFGFAWYSWRRSDHPVSDPFARLLVADGAWALFTLAEGLDLLGVPVVVWGALITLSAALAASFFFLFVVEYTGDTDWVPTSVKRLVVAHGPIYTFIYLLNPGELVVTGRREATYGVFRLVVEELGPIAGAELTFIYTLLGVSFLLLGRLLFTARNLYRKQTAVIFTVTLAVTLANIAFFSGFAIQPGLDLTPLFFVVQAVGIGVALYRYDFLDVTPMAADTLFEEMADPVYVVDQDGTLVDWNEAAGSHLPSDVARPSLADVDIDGLQQVRTSPDGGTNADDATPLVTEVTTQQREDGRVVSVTYDARATPITDRYGIARGHVIALRDVTEREARQQALETQNQRLEEFTGIVSHDLRNPLQVIDGKVELARRTGDLSHLDDASDAVARMETMLEELLHLAREGQTIDEKAEVDLAAVCEAAWNAVGTETATLTVETDETVVADEMRLRQVFENLFRNAIEHGGEDVTVTVGAIDAGFYVADDGPGIPADERTDVFGLGVTTDTDGTGFGLAIVERIVEAHGWTIDYVDSEDGGARFEVTDIYPSGLTDA
jgi:signal transduction histidine kinase